jgi:hypothetical protein
MPDYSACGHCVGDREQIPQKTQLSATCMSYREHMVLPFHQKHSHTAWLCHSFQQGLVTIKVVFWPLEFPFGLGGFFVLPQTGGELASPL